MAGYTSIAVFFSCAVFLLATAPRDARVARWMSARWLQFFGKYSYGMYVWHAMIAEWIMRTAPFLRDHAGLRFPMVGQWIQVLVGLAASFGLAFLSYQLFEKHFLSLKRFFEYKMVPHAGDDDPPGLVSEDQPGQSVAIGSLGAPPK
jgi:peptidoglycan/LPS O-acetylase OafA/YrhL